MNYSSTGLLAFAVHVIINLEALKKTSVSGERKLEKDRYRYFLYSAMLYYISDILWGILYGFRIIPLAYADTVLYFLSMVLSVLLWTRYVVSYLRTESSFNKVLVFGGWFIFVSEVAALIVNLFVPFVFGYGADKEYQPKPARYISLFIQMVLFILTSIYTFFVSIKSEGEEKLHHRTICFSGLIMTLFIALQSLFPLLPYYAAGLLLATCMIHTFLYRDELTEQSRKVEAARRDAHRDPLTGVRNKLAYIENKTNMENRIESGELKEFGIVVFDMNGLKKINDTLGHDVGDEYIKAACRIICQQFKHSPVFRIGGDEFVALLEGGDYEDRLSLLRAFDHTIEQNQKEGKVVVSAGISVFQPAGNDSFDECFRRADMKMYQRKEVLKRIG